MSANGELLLLEEVVKYARTFRNRVTILDIGANVGIYSLAAAKLASDMGCQNIEVISLEACGDTHKILADNIRCSAFSDFVSSLSCAVSDRCGTSQFNVIAAAAGRNSLLPIEEADKTMTEEVRVTTIDQILNDRKLEYIDLVKVDTEGHDHAVLCGARQSLKAGIIGVVQFEYNWRWIEQRAYLRDVFRLTSEMPYYLGKVTPNGLELFENWCPQLETLTENNYAIVRHDLMAHFAQTKTVSIC